jgi:hypothetical protein
VGFTRCGPVSFDQHFDFIGASRALEAETAVHLKLARISVVLARLSAASEEHIGTDMEACYGRAAERIRELLQHHDTPRLGSAILGRRTGKCNTGTTERTALGACGSFCKTTALTTIRPTPSATQEFNRAPPPLKKVAAAAQRRDDEAAPSCSNDGDSAETPSWLVDGDGSQDDYLDFDLSRSDGGGDLGISDSGAGSSDNAAAATREDVGYSAGADSERAQADAAKVKKHQAAANVNAAKQRAAAAAAKKHKTETAAKC